MRNITTKFALLALFTPMALAAAPKVNSLTQINWPPITGTIAPAGTCAAGNYGQPYTNTSNGNFYVCASSGWVLVTGGGGGIGGSGTATFYALFGASTTIGNGHLSDDGTNNTSTEPFIVNDGTGKAGHVGLVQGTATTNDTTAVTLTAPTSVTSYRIQFPGVHPSGSNTYFSCTAADPAVCTWAAGGGGGSSAPSAAFNISTGVSATPAAPYLVAPSSGTVSNCYFTTTTSDGATNLVFNVKFNGSNIISGTNATVTAGTSAGTISTFSLTSGTITITQGQKWELDITGGTSSWTGVVQCY